VKVEQEIRHVPTREREWQIDRLVGLVRSLASTDEGQRELAAIAAAYLREHRPQTTSPDSEVEAVDAAANTAPRAREPRRDGGGGGGGRSGGGGRGGGGRGRGRRGGGRR
jgi:hypothetical protein